MDEVHCEPSEYTRDKVLRARERIIVKHGAWTAHNIRLLEDVYTIRAAAYDWATHRGRWCGFMSSVLLHKKFSELRVLDLGCLEGGLSLALGSLGCQVTGIDIREDSLAKATFARDVLGLENVRFLQGDMLKMDQYGLGTFDVIVCAGTLYHVDAPDLIPFLRLLKGQCSGIVIFDTHVAVERREEYVDEEGQSYYGRTFVESHYISEEIEEKKKDLWGSLHNVYSFWPTERSLMNMLGNAGFGIVIKPMVPVMEWRWQDRGFWIAFSRMQDRLEKEYQYPVGRLADPGMQAPHHEMLDDAVQKNCRNPATILMDKTSS